MGPEPYERFLLLGALTLAAACGRIGYDAQGRGAAPGAFDAQVAPGADGGALAELRDARGIDADGAPRAPEDAADATPAPPDVLPALPDVLPPLPDVGGRDVGGPVALDGAGRDVSADLPAVAPPDYCAALPALAAPPVIDGRLEPGLTPAPLVPEGWTAMAPIPAGHRTALAVAWRPDGLYVHARVWDPDRVHHGKAEPWCGDGVELFVDSDARYANPPAYDDPGGRQFIVAAPLDATTPLREGHVYFGGSQREGPWRSTRYGAFPLPDGYVVEAFVVAADLGLPAWALAAGGAVGFDLGVDVSGPTEEPPNCPQRLGQYFLRVDPAPTPDPLADEPFRNVRAFCAPRLAGP